MTHPSSLMSVKLISIVGLLTCMLVVNMALAWPIDLNIDRATVKGDVSYLDGVTVDLPKMIFISLTPDIVVEDHPDLTPHIVIEFYIPQNGPRPVNERYEDPAQCIAPKDLAAYGKYEANVGGLPGIVVYYLRREKFGPDYPVLSMTAYATDHGAEILVTNHDQSIYGKVFTLEKCLDLFNITLNELEICHRSSMESKTAKDLSSGGA